MKDALLALYAVVSATAMGIAPLIPLMCMVVIAVENPKPEVERKAWGQAFRFGLACFSAGFIMLLLAYGLGWMAPTYRGIPLWEQKNYIAEHTRR
ncbi:hypothetical protein HOU02_gp411 [Caulobacter phage CcrBL9]|uniref:Uncharacterized protein n=1 Tax=Caulobacter phage CcrBL9 TaxID=2283270 RepID=A0A385EBP9_9CAUD|nr:hypothetical protein HOU02_gp411 [Caulobacter phage CcrBL9]AXQ69314.1 hypothetical protein CcrBL9_gp290 [Caulobacter phage CcrBL9]